MESQNKRTPLHAAAEGGHSEICHMLVQVRFLIFFVLFFCVSYEKKHLYWELFKNSIVLHSIL